MYTTDESSAFSLLRQPSRFTTPVTDRCASSPFQLVVATGGVGGPEKTYKFPQGVPQEPHNLCLFEHVEGCRVCSELYGHYLLPSGRLAHFYIGDTVRKGHRVDLVQPPGVSFDTEVSTCLEITLMGEDHGTE